MTREKKPKILVVDDDERWHRKIRRILQPKYELVCVTEPVAGLRALLDFRYALVILDMRLPGGISGLDIFSRMQEISPGLRAVILTGYPDSHSMRGSFSKGIFDYLSKSNPNLSDELISVAKEAEMAMNLNPVSMKNIERLYERHLHPIKVFVSYADPNTESAIMIHNRLHDNGFIPWIDKVHLLGVRNPRWDKEIEEAIYNSDFFICCLSDNAIKRNTFFQNEIRYAIAKHGENPRFIVPITFGAIQLPTSLAKLKIQYISYDSPSDRWWKNLVMRLSTKIQD